MVALNFILPTYLEEHSVTGRLEPPSWRGCWRGRFPGTPVVLGQLVQEEPRGAGETSRYIQRE